MFTGWPSRRRVFLIVAGIGVIAGLGLGAVAWLDDGGSDGGESTEDGAAGREPDAGEGADSGDGVEPTDADGGDPVGSGSGSGDASDAARAGTHGPLCEFLPVGDDPGGPLAIADERADVALTWIPVLTIFEAGVRAAGLAGELRDANGITILAPTDDAFTRTFTQDTLDDLIISRPDELRTLLESHMVDGALSLPELVEADAVTTRSGRPLTISSIDSEARLDDRAQTVCADYRVANARIHVIDGVLGELPAPAPPSDPVSG
ncbi:MAG: fasciclin domain-containing protein [Acidimicrobiales bacterium]